MRNDNKLGKSYSRDKQGFANEGLFVLKFQCLVKKYKNFVLYPYFFTVFKGKFQE
jgi:hypothetical protein